MAYAKRRNTAVYRRGKPSSRKTVYKRTKKYNKPKYTPRKKYFKPKPKYRKRYVRKK